MIFVPPIVELKLRWHSLLQPKAQNDESNEPSWLRLLGRVFCGLLAAATLLKVGFDLSKSEVEGPWGLYKLDRVDDPLLFWLVLLAWGTFGLGLGLHAIFGISKKGESKQRTDPE